MLSMQVWYYIIAGEQHTTCLPGLMRFIPYLETFSHPQTPASFFQSANSV